MVGRALAGIGHMCLGGCVGLFLGASVGGTFFDDDHGLGGTAGAAIGTLVGVAAVFVLLAVGAVGGAVRRRRAVQP
jgi:hypothetical protein